MGKDRDPAANASSSRLPAGSDRQCKACVRSDRDHGLWQPAAPQRPRLDSRLLTIRIVTKQAAMGKFRGAVIGSPPLAPRNHGRQIGRPRITAPPNDPSKAPAWAPSRYWRTLGDLSAIRFLDAIQFQKSNSIDAPSGASLVI